MTGGILKTVNQEKIKRRREAVSPYKRKKGKDFMNLTGAVVKEGPWGMLEILCLLVCHEVIQSNNLPINSLNCGKLYRCVAESKKVQDMELTIGTKSTAQVAAKMAHLRKHES
jgi:hypothetical protein